MASLGGLGADLAHAGVPNQFNAQGVLRNAQGELIELTEARITFKLYSAATGGDLLWSETQTVAIVLGAFSARIPGDVGASLPAAVQTKLGTGARMWLGVALEGQPELPRTELVSVPYAFTADRALVASAIDCTGCIDASAIDMSSVVARDLSYVPVSGGLIRATDVASALAELETYLTELTARFDAHAADPDAHHPADSAGIAIRPTSVTVGASALTDGALKLGPGANDTLGAAQVATLTGGGNADMLHTHSAQSITGNVGGSCFTTWNTTSCPRGYASTYRGFATAMAPWDGSNYGGMGSPICAKDMELNQSNSTTSVRWVSPNPLSAATQFGHAWNQSLKMPCAVCCPSQESDASCVAALDAIYPKSTNNTVIIPGTGVNNATAYRTAPFTLGSTFANRKYRITRLEVALTASGTANAPTQYDLRLLDANLNVLGQWPLTHLGDLTDSKNELNTCSNSCGFSTDKFPTYAAELDLTYTGGTQLRAEVVDVTTGSTNVQLILIQSTCANNECAPWHRVSGCSVY
jgi:hypothetical protein